MASSSKPFSVAVIGGGIAGVTLTISLLARNIDVHLYERDANFEEVGAGIGLGPNAIKAMSICDPGIKKAFDKVATSPGDPGKEIPWLDFLDGYSKNDDSSQRRMFQIYHAGGAQGCHRAHFLDECVKLIPKNVTHFRKQLDRVIDQGDKGLVLQFSDGSRVTADAVVGCDGIRSRVRQLILGEDNPESYPQYSHVYAYRGLLPMDKAVEAMGKDTAMSRVLHMGAGANIVAYPVADGKLLNVAAFVHDPTPWSHKRLDVPADPAAVISDYATWPMSIVKLSKLLSQYNGLNCWGIFDLGDHPLSTYAKGRICIIGDAAHASSPHIGAGAGMGVEDSAVMAEMLAEVQRRLQSTAPDEGGLTAAGALEVVFQTFDACRRERTQWLVQNSRVCCEIYQWRFPPSGNDMENCKEELEWRARRIWDLDVEGMVKDAVKQLEKSLEARKMKVRLARL